MIKKVGRGIGTGKAHFPQSTFRYCDVGVQINGDEEAPTSNCDNFLWGYFFADQCGTAYKVVGDMGMVHIFQLAHITACDVGWDMVRGGCLDIKGGGAYHGVGTLIRTGKQGSNGGRITLRGFKLDAQTEDLVLLDMTDGHPVQAVIDGLRWSGSWNKNPATAKPRIILRGPATLTLRDCVPLRAGMIESHPDLHRRIPIIDVNNSLVPENPRDLISGGKAWLRTSGCRATVPDSKGGMAPIDDFAGLITKDAT